MFRGERPPGSEWSARDRELALALAELERSICDGCGIPSWLGHEFTLSEDWEAEAFRCHSCTARLREAENRTNASQPGALRFAVTQIHRKPRPKN